MMPICRLFINLTFMVLITSTILVALPIHATTLNYAFSGTTIDNAPYNNLDGHGDAITFSGGRLQQGVFQFAETRGQVEFDISSLNEPVTSAELTLNTNVIAGQVQAFGTFPVTIEVYIYSGNGVGDAADFENGQLLVTYTFNKELSHTLDVTSGINNLIAADTAFAGFSLRMTNSTTDTYYVIESLSGPSLFISDINDATPFTGDVQENWESFLNWRDDPNEVMDDPTSIMNGNASITYTDMLIYEPTGLAVFGLGGVDAQVNDGIKGMGLNYPNATATISFDAPVTKFGAYWGAANALCCNGLVTVSFFDGSNNLVGTDSFTYLAASAGALEWYGWSFIEPISSISYQGDYVVNDSLRIVSVDSDFDSYYNDVDNCPTVFNPDQADTNDDGFGDACVSPDVTVPDGSDLGSGTTVGAGSSINKDVSVGDDSSIGEGVSLNTGVEAGDGVVIDDGTNVNRGASLGSETSIGSNVIIGKNCVIGERVTIGDNTTLGQGCIIGDDSNIGADVNIGRDVTVLPSTIIPDGTVIGKGLTVPPLP